MIVNNNLYHFQRSGRGRRAVQKKFLREMLLNFLIENLKNKAAIHALSLVAAADCYTLTINALRASSRGSPIDTMEH